MFEKEAKHECRAGRKKEQKELARNVLCQYRSLCRIAGVDYLTGDLLDSCIDQQNQRQNMALTEVKVELEKLSRVFHWQLINVS